MAVTLYLGDCLEFMKTMPDKSVDAVITDPPYGVGLQYGDHFTDDIEYIKTIIPPLVQNGCRIGRVLLFPSGRYAIEKWVYNELPPIWRICWYKGAQSTASSIGFSDWEMIFVYGEDVFRFSHDHFFAPTTRADNGHPCPKSVDWAKWLIVHFSKEGDTIFDPFMGSGTTGVACVQLGRNFIGAEIDPRYFEIAKKRIEQASLQPRLFQEKNQEEVQLHIPFAPMCESDDNSHKE